MTAKVRRLQHLQPMTAPKWALLPILLLLICGTVCVAQTAPTGLKATAVSSSQINLSWTDTSQNETGFKIERYENALGKYVQVGTTGANVITFSSTGLTASLPYYYRVRAYSTAGNSGYSNMATATTKAALLTTPTAPTGLVATAVSSSQINLSWSDTSGETGFKIERSTSATGTFVQVGTTGSSVTAFSNTALAASSPYYYRVRAYNTAGNSAYSNTANATTLASIPTAPTTLVATAVSASQIDLSWTDTSSSETGFKIERSASATGTFVEVGTTTGANVKTFSNTALAASTPYYYRVRAYNTAGNSGYSNTTSATTQTSLPTIPSAPTGLVATAVSSSQINLSWSDTSGETGFKIERSTSATGTFAEVGTTTGANVKTFSNTALAASTPYYYRVYAYNTAGNSAYSNTATTTTQASLPTAPTALVATTVSASQIDLSWTDTSSSETGFKIERSASATGTFVEVGTTTGANVKTFSNTALAASTPYYYRVYAYNTAGNSAYSNTTNATTLASIPTAPTTLVATAVSTSQINLSWSDTSSNETGFKIERSPTGVTGTFVPLVTNIAANVTTFSNTGLTASTTYYYRVCAYNTAGNSGYSNVANAATQAPPPTLPTAPTALAATAVSSSQINLSWSDNSSDETGFKIERSPTGVTGTFVQVGTAGANVTTFSNTDLTASTPYYYRVCAYNTAGNSLYSNTANATTLASSLSAPTGLTIESVSTTELKLTWIDTSSNEFGFEVERANDSAGAFVKIAQTGAGGTGFSDTTLSEGQTRYYRVRAYGMFGYSGYSGIQSEKTKLNTPTNLAGVAQGTAKVALKWTDNSSAELTYLLERTETSTWAVLVELPANSSSYLDTTCLPGKTYNYRVTAKGSTSDPSNVAVVSTPAVIAISPQWVGHVSFDHLSGVYGSYDVAVSDEYLYAVSGGTVSIYAITNQTGALPTFVSQRAIDTPYSVATSLINNTDEYAFVTDGTTLRIISPTDPAFLKNVELPGYGYRLCCAGNYVYVACGTAGLVVVDVSDPYNPYKVYDKYLRPDLDFGITQAWAVDVYGSLAVVANGADGLVALEVSDPVNPALVGYVTLPGSIMGTIGSAVDVDLEGDTAWVAAGNNGLCQVNVSPLSPPSWVRTVPTTASALGVCVEGNYVFVACNNGISARTGVDVFGCNGTSLVPVTFLPSIGYGTYQVAARTGRIYLTDNLFLIDVAEY